MFKKMRITYVEDTRLKSLFAKSTIALLLISPLACKKTSEKEVNLEGVSKGTNTSSAGGENDEDQFKERLDENGLSLVCDRISGSPKFYQGTGACGGNVNINLPLDSVYSGLALIYDSTLNTNRSGFGSNIILNEMAYVQFADAGNSWLQRGDGSFIDLVKSTEDSLKGAWVASDRSEFTGIIEKVDANRIVQREVGGDEYYYVRVDGKIFALEKVVNRFNEAMLIKVDGSGKGEYILYSDGTRIEVVRSGNNISITRADGKASATLQLDSSNRLSKMTEVSDSGKNTLVFNLTYAGNTNLLVRYEVEFNGESVEWGSYTYDQRGRQQLQRASDDTGTFIERDDKARTVTTKDQSGHETVETFNVKGQIVKSAKFLSDNKEVILYEASYQYTPSGNLQSVSYIKARTEYQYNSVKPNLLETQRDFVDGKLVRTRTISWDAVRELPTKMKVLGVNGEVLQESEFTWQSSWPYLLVESVDQRFGRKNTYSYPGLRTIQQSFTRSVHPTTSAIDWTHISTEELTKRDVTKTIDALTTQDKRETTLGYDAEGQVTSVAQGDKAASIEYDTEGRVIAVRSTETVVEKSYDTSGYLILEKTTYLKTGKQQIVQYSRTIDGEGVIQSASTQTTHPSGVVDTMQYSFKDGEINGAMLNGVTVDF